MKIVDAYWEKRNLGTTCKEVLIEPADSIKEIEDFLMNLNNVGYLVFKIPSGGINYIEFLSEHGFCFVETIIEVMLRIDTYKLPPEIERFDRIVDYRLLPVKELDRLGAEIKKGIFNTNRIALDSRFGIDVAANRYFNWIKDEVAIGNHVYETYYENVSFGFFALKQKGKGILDNYLAGMYINKSSFGYGFSILSKSIEEVKRLGGKQLITHISSNNLPVIRLYIKFGFIPYEISYVMIKHFLT